MHDISVALMISIKPAGNIQRLFIGVKLKVNSASCWSVLYRPPTRFDVLKTLRPKRR
jgi:hypothetical protein